MNPNSRREFGFGVDVGGTFAKIVLANRDGRVLDQSQIETAAEKGPMEFIRRLTEETELLAQRSGLEACSLGLGIAGDVDTQEGKIRFSPNLKKFAGVPFKKVLSSRLKIPVTVENDANAAAWGGYVLELNRKVENAVCVTLGTGVGGGLILGGKMYRGSTGSAGEIGHMCVEADGALCGCGARGCLEAYAGGKGLRETALKLLEGSPKRKSILRSPAYADLTPEMLSKAAKAGDPIAQSVWDISGYYLGLGILSLVCILNLDRVLLVGGVSKAGSLILNPVSRVLNSSSFRTPCGHVRVLIGRTPDLGAVGAALLGLEEV